MELLIFVFGWLVELALKLVERCGYLEAVFAGGKLNDKSGRIYIELKLPMERRKI